MTVHTATQATPLQPKPGPYILSPVRHAVDWRCEELPRGGMHQCEQPPYMYHPVIAPRVQQSKPSPPAYGHTVSLVKSMDFARGFAVLSQFLFAQFIAVCRKSKWSKHATNSPLLALRAMAGSKAACKISSACSHALC